MVRPMTNTRPKKPTETRRSFVLKLVIDEARRGSLNLAIDETLLNEDESWLRFYRWKPATISLGYFQRLADFQDLAPSWPLVRRCTGGAAILHAHEITFALALPVSALPRRLELGYAQINAAIVRVAQQHGQRLLAPTVAAQDSRWCFAAPNGLDLVDERGAKVAGSAQRRRGSRLLHHGSILLTPPPEQSFCGSLELAPTEQAQESFILQLAAAFTAGLGAQLERRSSLSPAILARAKALEEKRYAAHSWLARR